MLSTKTVSILLGLLFPILILGSDITTNYIDFAGTYQGDKSNLLTRVEKTVDVDYNYVTSSQNNWAQFPDMKIEFEL